MKAKNIAYGAIALLCSACASDGVGTSGHTVRDSAGVTIVESSTPIWGANDAWRIGEHPLVTIGGIDGDPNYELFRVVDAVRLNDGRIVVGNAGTHEFRFFDSEGRFLSASGGQGDGPGEFQALSWINPFRGDSLMTYDRRQRRLSVFDTDGSFQRSVSAMSIGETSIRVAGVFDDGSFLSHGSRRSVSDRPMGLIRPDELLFHQSETGDLVDSLGAFPGREGFVHASGPGILMIVPAFGRTSLFFPSSNQFYVTTNDSYEIKRYTSDGALTSVIRRQFSNLEVAEEDIQILIEQRSDNDMTDEMRRMWDEAFAAVPVPETMPAYSSALVDDQGNLWIEEYRRPGDEVPHWTVFDIQGVMLGTVVMPTGFELLQAGEDYVLGTWSDELDVEHVHILELFKGNG